MAQQLNLLNLCLQNTQVQFQAPLFVTLVPEALTPSSGTLCAGDTQAKHCLSSLDIQGPLVIEFYMSACACRCNLVCHSPSIPHMISLA